MVSVQLSELAQSIARKDSSPKWFIIIINAGKLNCKNYSITDLVFQEHTSQIQDFFRTFSTSVQFHNFSGPEKSKLKFQDPWEPWKNLWNPQTLRLNHWAMDASYWLLFCGMMNYFITLWKEEWFENLREAGEGYKC